MNRLNDIRARTEAATEGPWKTIGTGVAGGDHWYICDDGESIALISANDGDGREDQRHDDAVFIAHARQDIPRLLAALDSVLALHLPDDPRCVACLEEWPCTTVARITEALA